MTRIIEEQLADETKFTPVTGDPRQDTRHRLLEMIDSKIENGTMTKRERYLITGKTEKDGVSHSPDFQVSKPHMYPLFKGHKLTLEQIKAKVIPPTRMVTAAIDGPTYRLGMFVNGLLKQIARDYCRGEIVQDTTEFLKKMEQLRNNGAFAVRGTLLGTLDVDALYPSINQELALEAIEHAVATCTNYDEDTRKTVIDLTAFCLKNSVIHYRGQWFKSCEGIPTGGPESDPIANIYVRWMLDTKILPQLVDKDKSDNRTRFLDDLSFTWRGSARQFSTFLNAVNKIGGPLKFTLKGEVGTEVNFLDVTLILEDGDFRTSLFVKPTDSARYLNRRSDHSHHQFKSSPYSQFRRAVVICSRRDDCIKSIEYMEKKYLDSGYKPDELRAAKEKALLLDRDQILANERGPRTVNDDAENDGILTYVIQQDPNMMSVIKTFMKSKAEILKKYIGDRRLIVAERRNPNIASLLFAKSSFSKCEKVLRPTQACGSSGCLTCSIMSLPNKIKLNNDINIKLDFSLTCKTDNCIYLFICNECEGNSGFYFGKTFNRSHIRFNSHRSSFKVSNNDYEKSALSHHIFLEHLDNFPLKLNNFKVGIVGQAPPRRLDRLEDFYIYNTKADVLSLNRYRAVD